MPASIKVMIVDDHPLVRVGMATVINQQSDMTIVADTDSGHRALELYRSHHPDVVLMDMRLRGDSGARATSALMAESSDARVLMISNYEGDEEISQALAAGAKGYLFKSVMEDELVDAIREIHAGRNYMPKSVSGHLLGNGSGGSLTRREEEMLELLGKGLNNREMGQVLGIAEDTVKTLLKGLLTKLDVSSRAKALPEAKRRGLIRE